MSKSLTFPQPTLFAVPRVALDPRCGVASEITRAHQELPAVFSRVQQTPLPPTSRLARLFNTSTRVVDQVTTTSDIARRLIGDLVTKNTHAQINRTRAICTMFWPEKLKHNPIDFHV